MLNIQNGNPGSGSILRKPLFSDQVEPPVNLAERATLKKIATSLVEKISQGLDSLTEEISLDAFAEGICNKLELTEENTQVARNYFVNAYNAVLEIPIFASKSASYLETKKNKILGLERDLPPEALKEVDSALIEALRGLQADAYEKYGANSGEQAHLAILKEVPVVGKVLNIYEASQPAKLEADVAHFKDTLGSQDPEAILEAVSRVDKTVGELRKEQLDQKRKGR